MAVVVIVLFAYFVLLLIVSRSLSQTIKARKKYKKDEILFHGKLSFAGGLNLPANVPCNLICLKNRVVFESSGQEFNLPSEKLVDVSVVTNTEIQKQYVSSIGGSVAGAMLFGPIGAVIGGSASKRNIKSKTQYLIFSYSDEGNIKFILFKVDKNKLSFARRFERQFRKLKERDNVTTNL